MTSCSHRSSLVFAFLVFAAGCNTTAGITLTDDGQPKAAIAHNGNAGAAKNLQAYLQKITGATLPVVRSANDESVRDKTLIVLEKVETVAGASDRPTARQAYRIKTDGDVLRLRAASDLGMQYAVWGFLEDHLGCRFYSFKARGLSYAGPGHEIVPRQPSLTLKSIDELREPVLAQRGFIFWPGSYTWIIKNRGAGYPADELSGSLNSGHVLHSYIPTQDQRDGNGKVTVKGLFAEHPQFYPMNGTGQREPSTWAHGVCGTNPDLPLFLAKGMKRAIARAKEQQKDAYDPKMPLQIGQGDGFSGCQCPDCRALVHDERSEAAPLILLFNRALNIIGKTDPEQQFITFAYFETLDAPKSLKPHKNLWINVVSSARSQNSAGDQVGPIAGNPANRDYARALEEWPKIAPNRVTVWHWDTYRSEWPSVFYLAENIRYMRDCGVYGVSPQYCGGPWTGLLAWVFLKLAWNPDQDADALIRQYLDDCYGKSAGEHVYTYLKLGQAAYADSCHVPSAVRWSGWTEITRQKILQPVLPEMIAAMDQAQAAAERAGDEVLLANLLAARGTSLDVVVLDHVAANGRPWGPVKSAADGRNWFVAGADPLVPSSLRRAKTGIAAGGGGEHGVLREISWYVANRGGPMVELASPAMAAAVCPDLKGQIVSAVDKRTNRELLSVQGGNCGYADTFDHISSQIWLPAEAAENDLAHPRLAERDWTAVWSEFKNPTQDSLETDLTISPPYYGFDASRHLRRTVRVTEDGMRIERSYTGKLDQPDRFSSRWLLALPQPGLAKVAVMGGGIDRLLDLRYAVPGGIRGVKAGQHLPGQDNMDERFDTVVAVSDTETVTLPIAANSAGDLVVRLDRGDGVATIVTTPAAGWEALDLKPVVDRDYLQLTLVGARAKAPRGVKDLPLPVQTLTAKTVPATAGDAAAAIIPLPDAAGTAGTGKPKIKITGPATAVNQIDGAELVWVPAGTFLRGSPEGAGAGDERPQRRIELDGYWIYRTQVTVAQYKKFCAATARKFEPTWGQGMHADSRGDDDAYAVLGSWYEAEAYAAWAGVALPTEAQWEKAARGTDGRDYPWGDAWDPQKCVSMERTVYEFSPGFLPVGSTSRGASPCGAQDMAGGVWEWVADWYDYEYYRRAPARNPTGPDRGTHRVLRGGCSLFDERFCRAAARMINPPHVRDWTPTGFRCVVNAGGPEKTAAEATR